MARTKWKLAFFSYLILVNVCTKSLPITQESLTVSNTVFKQSDVPDIEHIAETLRSNVAAVKQSEHSSTKTNATVNTRNVNTDGDTTEALNITRNSLLRQIRPGQIIRQYALELTANGNTFTGRAVIDVELTFATREDPIMLHVEGLTIQSVMAAIFTEANALQADISIDDGILEVTPQQVASTYILIITYTGSLAVPGVGFYRGQYQDFSYLAMNLNPTHARRVFPCMDEPTEASIISFTFHNLGFSSVMSNSLLEDNSDNQFRALQGPPHLWAMVAHNLNNIIVPTAGVFLHIRPNVLSQESQASVAINAFYNNLNLWTNKPFTEIVLNQASELNVLALPDVSRDWVGLSTVGIWEPFVLMETGCSARQRFLGLSKIAEALSRQWFGQVIFPENWRYEWIVAGLASYAAYDILRDFETNQQGLDITLLDINTLFVTEVLQESMYRDGYSSALPLEISADLFDEDAIRDYIYGIHKVKAPALLRMMRLILGDENQDFIQIAGQALLAGRALQPVNYPIFIDAMDDWTHNGNNAVDEIEDFLEPWVQNNGFPLIHVGLMQGGVLVTQERFGYSSQPHVAFNLPITYTVSTNPNFDNIYPITMMEGTMTFSMFLDEDEGDFCLFNIQGQGYYRVNYDNDLWERIIEALEDPERREQIHPLNRATLIDDSLNLARSGRINYDIALRVALAMEHETEYAPWKAFIRNMSFLGRRLIALVEDDDDLDPDIYLRMVRRGIVAFESEVGFYPDTSLIEPTMTSLTRGLVMDHACRVGYQPCIAAAVDWFYDPNSVDLVVNPNIPADIRPAVYCAMMREGGDDIINALYDRLAIEPSMYERVVILESLTCSRDMGFVRTLLDETIAVNSQYTAEERVRIFKAAAASSTDGGREALSFLSLRVNEVRNMYGGDEKLEEIINHLAEHIGDGGLSMDFNIWVYAQNNALGDSQFPAERAAEIVMENLEWDNRFMDFVYEWIDENDAPTVVVSCILISISCLITLFNH